MLSRTPVAPGRGSERRARPVALEGRGALLDRLRIGRLRRSRRQESAQRHECRHGAVTSPSHGRPSAVPLEQTHLCVGKQAPLTSGTKPSRAASFSLPTSGRTIQAKRRASPSGSLAPTCAGSGGAHSGGVGPGRCCLCCCCCCRCCCCSCQLCGTDTACGGLAEGGSAHRHTAGRARRHHNAVGALGAVESDRSVDPCSAVGRVRARPGGVQRMQNASCSAPARLAGGTGCLGQVGSDGRERRKSAQAHQERDISSTASVVSPPVSPSAPAFAVANLNPLKRFTHVTVTCVFHPHLKA